MPRKSRWPVAGAMLVSAVLHAVVLTGARIALPERVEVSAPLEARLAPAAQPPAAPAAVPPPREPRKHAQRPARPRASRPAVIARAPSLPALQNSFTVSDEDQAAVTDPQPDATVAEPSPAAAAPDVVAVAPSTTLPIEEPPPVRLLPRRGRIAYTLYLGTDRFEIGRTVQNWEFENGVYRIGSVSETTGVAAVFRSERRTYLSRGAVTSAGLQPESFLMSRLRRGETEVARAQFDWDAKHITWGTPDEKKDAPLPLGTQDFLSLMYQLAIAPPAGGRIAVPITTGTKFETYELDVLPEETIDTPLGSLRALPLRQVRKPGAESIQIWLAADYRYLPAKIRFFGRNGEPSGEQVVNGLKVDE